MDKDEFRSAIYSHYERKGRRFPWREKIDPWGIMVSEFMLQQTQTDRVTVYWSRFMKKWPDPPSLAKASLEEALREWNGLGYNRRCYYLKDCARRITKEYEGDVPDNPKQLIALPGIGPYTAGAIPCFAYNHPSVFIETNIRAAFLHFFFKDRTGVNDREILPLIAEHMDRENPRKWYWALMDYGVALKKLTVNPNRRSAHYAKQSPFAGSFRQHRGTVIRVLVTRGPANLRQLQERSGMEEKDIYKVLEALGKELLVAENDGVYRIRER
ncbi:MAG: A/G-specific adenine glycosylase [Treponema sp.]|jgi:A/G-specific adenine glycosylase|nr:A/G-specific adenine glycosylase [Treponema sp.]